MRASSRILRLVLAVALASGCCILVCGLHELLRDSSTQSQYAFLARQTLGNQGTDERSGDARRLPNGAIAWVEVGNTNISLPVADGSRGESWYLHHDLWDRESGLGCPFVDPRCASPTGPHVIVYGHHLAFTNYMFSPLHLCFRQKDFSRLGTCTWTTSLGKRKLHPLCALSVDSHWQDIMRFSFSGDAELHAWLASVLEASSARASNATALAARADHVLTLVTCTSNRSGQPWRTLVIFAS